MPRLPRDVSGSDLVQRLGELDYREIRQVGSHIRLECISEGKTHRLTIPEHDSLRLGTLNGILSDIAAFHGIPKSALIKIIFED